MYPRIAGNALYPGGAPVSQESCHYDDKTPSELFALHNQDKLDEFGQQMLKDWMIYFMTAPIFQGQLGKDALEKMSVDELWEECMSIGLDPF